jgi:hypothetical protein
MLAFSRAVTRAPEWLHLFGGAVLAARILHSLLILIRSRLSTFSATTTYTLSFSTTFWSPYCTSWHRES